MIDNEVEAIQIGENPGTNVVSRLQDEMLAIDPQMRLIEEEKMNIIFLILEYIKLKNPAVLDLALVQCQLNGISPLPPTLVQYLSFVASQRLHVIRGSNLSDVKKMHKSFDRNKAFIWTYKLINLCNLTKSKAILSACAALDERSPYSNLKSSSFEKYYDKWLNDNLYFDEVFKNIKWTPEQKSDFVKSFSKTLPFGLKGTRR